MENARVYQILIYFRSGERIAESFLRKKGVTDKEVAELLDLGYIIYVGESDSANGIFSDTKQYTITESGKLARDT